jgi:hypothetical protein
MCSVTDLHLANVKGIDRTATYCTHPQSDAVHQCQMQWEMQASICARIILRMSLCTQTRIRHTIAGKQLKQTHQPQCINCNCMSVQLCPLGINVPSVAQNQHAWPCLGQMSADTKTEACNRTAPQSRLLEVRMQQC